MILTGRRRVTTGFPVINRENLLQALSEANGIHAMNQKEIKVDKPNCIIFHKLS